MGLNDVANMYSEHCGEGAKFFVLLTKLKLDLSK